MCEHTGCVFVLTVFFYCCCGDERRFCSGFYSCFCFSVCYFSPPREEQTSMTNAINLVFTDMIINNNNNKITTRALFLSQRTGTFLESAKAANCEINAQRPNTKKKRLYRFFSAANSTPDACVICANLKKYQRCEIQFVFCSRLSFLLTKLLTVICDVCNNDDTFYLSCTLHWKKSQIAA